MLADAWLVHGEADRDLASGADGPEDPTVPGTGPIRFRWAAVIGASPEP
jgi:hypothetical protein